MLINELYMAPTIGEWVEVIDELPYPGAVVLGIGWCDHGIPVMKMVHYQIVDVDDDPDMRIVWTCAFGEGGVIPPPRAWASLRFDHPVGSTSDDEDEDDHIDAELN